MATDDGGEGLFLSRTIEAAIRIGAVAILAYFCFEIVRPFVQPILWATVIAVATHPLFRRLAAGLGGRQRTAAFLISAIALVVVIIPTVLLTASLMETAGRLSDDLRSGEIAVPAPPDAVGDWPVVGSRIYDAWLRASQNLESVLQTYEPQLRQVAQWMVSTAASTGVGILKFVLSIVLAGVLLAHAEAGRTFADAFSTRLVGDRGRGLTDLAVSTVQSVTRGILGVALLQAALVGLGCLAVGVPAAGLVAVVALLVAVVQLPVILVALPIIVYVFSTSSTGVAIAFLVWNVLVGLSDNVLKPLLLGRGVAVPMLVVFLGSIGGFVLDGIIGLFIGAVILALGYNLFTAWLSVPPSEARSVPSL